MLVLVLLPRLRSCLHAGHFWNVSGFPLSNLSSSFLLGNAGLLFLFLESLFALFVFSHLAFLLDSVLVLFKLVFELVDSVDEGAQPFEEELVEESLFLTVFQILVGNEGLPLFQELLQPRQALSVHVVDVLEGVLRLLLRLAVDEGASEATGRSHVRIMEVVAVHMS